MFITLEQILVAHSWCSGLPDCNTADITPSPYSPAAAQQGHTIPPSLHCTAASTPQDPKLALYNSSLPFLYKPFSPTLPAYLQTTSPHPYPSSCGLAHPGVRCSEQPAIKWLTFIRNRGSQLPQLFISALWCLIRKDEWCWMLGVWRLLPGCYFLPALAGRLLGSMGHGFNTKSLLVSSGY